MTLIHDRQFEQRKRWLPAKNIGTTTIPPYACVEVTGTTAAPVEDQVWTVRRPTSDSPAAVAINGPTAISPASGGNPARYGSITFDDPFFVLHTGSTPSIGDLLGPGEDVFTVSSAGTTFVCHSALFTDPDRVLARWSGGTERPRIAYTTSSITARSGSTAGSGTVTLYTVDGATMTSDTTGVTAYNFATQAVNTDTWVQVEKFSGDDWYITAVDCGA